MWKFCGKAQFPHSFGRHTRKSGEITVFFAVKYMRKTMVKIWLQLPLIISCIQIQINFNISFKMRESPFSKQKYPGHIFNSFLDHTLCRNGQISKVHNQNMQTFSNVLVIGFECFGHWFQREKRCSFVPLVKKYHKNTV